jgi:hypothetical protein
MSRMAALFFNRFCKNTEPLAQLATAWGRKAQP